MTRPRLGAVVAAVAYGWMAVGLVGIAGLLRSCAAPVLAILSQSWLFE